MSSILAPYRVKEKGYTYHVQKRTFFFWYKEIEVHDNPDTALVACLRLSLGAPDTEITFGPDGSNQNVES